MIFLAGLNCELDEIWGRILGLKPLPTIDEVFAEVWRENHHQVMVTDSLSSATKISALDACGPDA